MNLKNRLIYSIIVTYNGSEWIEKCLTSLLDSTIPIKIIVIDNMSTDDTIAIIKNKFTDCLLIESTENLGFGKANNIGLSLALKDGADFVFLLNQDAWVEKDTIEKLITKQQETNDFDIISPIHLNGFGDKLDYLFSIFIEPRKCPDLYSDIYCNNLKNQLYPVDFVNAAGWLLTRKCLQIIGGFSPIFYHYGEDDNYCLRAKYHGIKIGIYPLTHIFHDKSYNISKYDNPELIKERQKLVNYSDPQSTNNLINDIYINKMAAFKAILKLQFLNHKKYFAQYKKLRGINNEISSNVEISKTAGSSFL